MTTEAIFEVSNLKKYYPIRGGLLRRARGQVKAVDGVSFELRSGETLGLVGESGCGKSTLARTLLRLTEPTEGSAKYRGEEIFTMGPRALRRLRRDVQMIFQDPYSSLNPRLTVDDIVGEAFDIHGSLGASTRRERRQRVDGLLDRVGLHPSHASRYPHEFSGGQRQRIGIARALAVEPTVIICDEPVSALDVSVQAQVLNLLEDLQDEFGLAYIFIAHDLSVVRHLSDRIAIMYLGRIVEIGPGAAVYGYPSHPYSQALISAIPVSHPRDRGRDRRLIEGDIPSAANPPSGCHFRTRCWLAEELCAESYPGLEQMAGDFALEPHLVACHLVDSRVPSDKDRSTRDTNAKKDNR